MSIARVAPVVDGASLTLDLERYEIGAEVAPGDAVPLHVEAPLRFRATAPRGDVVLLTRGLSRLRDDGIFVRVAPSHRVDARPGHAGVEASIELAPGASLRWPLRCEQLTLEGTPNPDHSLEPVRGDGTLWKAATPSLAVSTRPATPGEWRLEGSPTVVFSRLERHGGWAHVVWQSWDWSALSGWVREADLEPGHAPPEHSESHHIPDREDCTLAPGARQVTLRVGTALHARPQGPRWAEVTRELSAIVASSADPDWPTVTALAGVHRSDDPGGCRALEHTFVRASALW